MLNVKVTLNSHDEAPLHELMRQTCRSGSRNRAIPLGELRVRLGSPCVPVPGFSGSSSQQLVDAAERVLTKRRAMMVGGIPDFRKLAEILRLLADCRWKNITDAAV